MDKNIEQLQKLGKIFNSEKIVTQEDIAQVLQGVLSVMNSFKKDNQDLNAETKAIVEALLENVSASHEKITNDLGNKVQDIDKVKKDVEKNLKKTFAKIEKLMNEAREMKPRDGIDGKDAEEVDTDKIIEEVLTKIEIPEVESETPESIVDKINLAPIDTDKFKIDFVHIKNAPNFASIKPNGGGWRNLFQLHDVSLNNLQNDQVLKWDATNNVWINGTGGGGTPGGSDTQLQYNNAGSFGGMTGYEFLGGILNITKAEDNIAIAIAGTDTLQKIDFGVGATNRGYISVYNDDGTLGTSIEGESISTGNLTLSPMTEGSVLFAGTGGLISQDNTNFFFDNTNKQLRLGTATGFDGSNQIGLTVGGNINNYYGQYLQNLSGGDTASTDIIVGANNDGTAFIGRYGDFGILGSGWASVSSGIIKNVSVSSGGTGYTVGDVLTITTGDANATVTVDTVSGGVVTSITLTTNGTGYSVSSSNATTGGTGTGCAINITALTDTTAWSANDVYQYASGGNLVIGTDGGVAGKIIKFHTGGTGSGNIRATIDDNATTVININSTALRGLVASQISSDTSSSRFNLLKARGTTATKTTVVTGDVVGNLNFWGYDGTNYINTASIMTTTTGTIGTNRMPSFLSFYTSTDASPSVLTERMRILANGNVAIGGTTASEMLTVTNGWMLLNTAYGIKWSGGSQLYEQSFRMLYQPNGDRFEVFNEAGTAQTASFHGAASALGAGVRLGYGTVIGNSFNSTGSVITNGLVVEAGAMINSGGTSYTMGTNNKFLVNTFNTVNNNAVVQFSTKNAGHQGLIIQGFTSQTANLQEWQNSAGTILTSIKSDGDINFATGQSRKIFGFGGMYIEFYNTLTGGFQFQAGSSGFTSNFNHNVSISGNLGITGTLTGVSSMSVASGGNYAGSASSRFTPYDGSTGNMQLVATTLSSGASQMSFWTGTTSTERMRISGTGEVGIGTTSPNANAILDVSSTTKAFMPPRMTTTQKNAISSPTAGMVVYDTTLNKLCVYTTTWETVTSL